MTRIRPEVQNLLDRLSRMDPRRPHFDRVLVERAIAAHLAALGLRARPIHWCSDTVEAQDRVKYNERWFRRTIVFASLCLAITVYPFFMAGYPSETLIMIVIASIFEFFRLTLIFFFAFIGVIIFTELVSGIARWFPCFRRHEDWITAAERRGLRIRSAAAYDAKAAALVPAQDRVRARIWEAAWAADRTVYGTPRVAARDAVAAVVIANVHAATGHSAVGAAHAVLSPLFEAFETGLFMYWVARREVICVFQPRLSIANDRLHDDRGPAMRWPNGTMRHFWRGVRVPAWFIEEPGRISVETIAAEDNLERRRCMIEIYGRERFLADAGARLLHRDAFGILWEARFSDVRWRFVEVVNGTPELDGTFRIYILDITGAAEELGWRIDTAHAAVAATYGLRPEQYRPDVRT